jgi:hypothetical protein
VDSVGAVCGVEDAWEGRMNLIRRIYGLSFTTAAMVCACATATEGAPVAGSPAGQTHVTSAQTNVDAAVVDRLSNARCDQEVGCKNIGPGQKFVSRSICMDQVRGSIGNELNAYACPRGLDSDAVDRCMAAIKSEECNHPFDTLTRYDKCRTTALCLK